VPLRMAWSGVMSVLIGVGSNDKHQQKLVILSGGTQTRCAY
jgi:hypothetical protein